MRIWICGGKLGSRHVVIVIVNRNRLRYEFNRNPPTINLGIVHAASQRNEPGFRTSSFIIGCYGYVSGEGLCELNPERLAAKSRFIPDDPLSAARSNLVSSPAMSSP